MPDKKDKIKVGLAQISPILLNKAATLYKVIATISEASEQKCDLVGFGEAFVPGYPFWSERTGGAEFESDTQKDFYGKYLKEGVSIEDGDLIPLCTLAKEKQISVYLGIMERAQDRGGHSLYASLVYINKSGEVCSVHRKLQPTYDERLNWAPGDGHGLRVHSLEAFTVGGLNCWENWMPLPRAALYGMGEDFHFACWPGGMHNTPDITRFIAKEARSFVMSVSGLMREIDIPKDVPHRELIKGLNNNGYFANGGSCLAGPDGKWIIEPILEAEGLVTAEIDHSFVRRERQNFDPAGHYSRPDVTRLIVNRKRQTTVETID